MTPKESMSPVHVRIATAADAESIADIYNLYVDAGGSTFDALHWEPAYVRKQLKIPAPDAWFVAVGDQDDDVLGWAALHRFSHRHGYRFSLESAIYLRPDTFGAGVGDALQRQLDKHCGESGIHHVMAKIVTDNHRSIAFHRRHGFETVGIQREIGNMTGDWIDVTIMQKVIDHRS
tara:strand:+ start:12452 stop:12979 length:528 start_codon:yes stop_codon:yes gene_type:complete